MSWVFELVLKILLMSSQRSTLMWCKENFRVVTLGKLATKCISKMYIMWRGSGSCSWLVTVFFVLFCFQSKFEDIALLKK